MAIHFSWCWTSRRRISIPKVKAACRKAILSVRRRGGIVVVIAHRPKALDGVDHVLVIAEGRVQSFGRKEDVLTKVLQRPVPLKVVADGQGATRWTAR